MDATIDLQALRRQLPRTWRLFFARHGRFTAVQAQAIPPLLAGRDGLIMAATASGKTEAVLAPLLERYWTRLLQPQLTLLYICPTRALVRDLFVRLQDALADTEVVVAMKTGDVRPFDQTRPPAILITTPESTDSLLTRAPKLFITLQAVIIDEVHLFDNTPRGDHLRCLLPRIERIRTYKDETAAPCQRVAISATVPDPAGVASRYLHDAAIIYVAGGRTIAAEITPLTDMAALVLALAQRAAQKSLVFCNTRDEVEQTAAFLRQSLPHHAEIFVHYGNLDSQMRLDVETRFAAAAVAVCVCTSTLELGIDIGSVDDIVLLGAPHTVESFLQRIGRGGRRTDQMRVLCLPKTPNEMARFNGLLALAESAAPSIYTPRYTFRPSVLVQQIFSLCKQNPTGGVRLGDVRRVAPDSVTSEDIRAIMSNLTLLRYVQPGRIGEWKPDEQLDELLDRHEIYSNIGADPAATAVVDAYSKRILAYTDQYVEKGQVVLFGGKVMRVVWRDYHQFGLAAVPRSTGVDVVLRYRKSYAPIPFDVTQSVARAWGIKPYQMPLLPTENGAWLFHFWGTIWGEWLTAALFEQGFFAEAKNEYALYVRPAIAALPAWDEGLAAGVTARLAKTLGERLQMGRFATLLPATVGVTAVIDQFDQAQLAHIYAKTKVVAAGTHTEKLTQLT